MASVSISVTAVQGEDLGPNNITVGAAAPGAGDVELRVNTANVTSLKQLFLILEKFDFFVEDTNLGPAAFGML